jgi:hypothetical protein
VPRPPEPPLVLEDEASSWEKLGTDTDDPAAHLDTASPSKRRGSSSWKHSSSTALATISRARLWWVVLGVSILVVILVILLLAVLLPSGPPREEPPEKPTPRTILVNRSGQPGTATTLKRALGMVDPKSSLGARIIVQNDITENALVVSRPNVTIETDHDNPCMWKCPDDVPATSYLLTVTGAPGFHLKGFTLDGGGRAESLLVLCGQCPGAKFENLELKNFQKCGMDITNCEGLPSSRILLTRLHFTTTQPTQAGMVFDSRLNGPINRNRFFTVRDCSFDGPGAKIKLTKPEVIDNVPLPPGIIPVGP